jgi:hypothetical protein
MPSEVFKPEIPEIKPLQKYAQLQGQTLLGLSIEDYVRDGTCGMFGVAAHRGFWWD